MSEQSKPKKVVSAAKKSAPKKKVAPKAEPEQPQVVVNVQVNVEEDDDEPAIEVEVDEIAGAAAGKEKLSKKVRREQNFSAIFDGVKKVSESLKSETGKSLADKLEKNLKKNKAFVDSQEFGKSLHAEFDKILKKYVKQIDQITAKIDKIQKKPGVKSAVLTGGFNKPRAITPEMAHFARAVGWKDGDEKSRNEVNKFLCSYIKGNDLQDASDGRIIHTDDALKGLLGLKDCDRHLNYAILQKHIGKLFV